MKNNNEGRDQFDSLLPKIFDGSVFSDSNESISDDSSDYFKKLLKYYKLKNKFKNNYVYSFKKESNQRKNTVEDDLILNIENKIPLLFQNEVFLKRISNYIFQEEYEESAYDSILGL